MRKTSLFKQHKSTTTKQKRTKQYSARIKLWIPLIFPHFICHEKQKLKQSFSQIIEHLQNLIEDGQNKTKHVHLLFNKSCCADSSEQSQKPFF